MLRREEDHTLSGRIKYTEGKYGKPGTTFLTQQQTNGIKLKIIDKIPLKKVIVIEKI